MGLSGRQYMVLAVLSADARAVTAGARRALRAAPAQVVPVIDKLEERGLRRPHSARRPTAGATSSASPRPDGKRSSRPTRWAARWSSRLDAEAADVVVKTLSRSYNTAPLEPT